MEKRGKHTNNKSSRLRSTLAAIILVSCLVPFYVERQVKEFLIKDLDKASNDFVEMLAESKLTMHSRNVSLTALNSFQKLHSHEKQQHKASNSTIITISTGLSVSSSGLPKELPKWMRTYFNWHAKHRNFLNESNWESEKYLILRCTHEDKTCGGLADRLKPLPYLILLAARHKRLFMIRWNRPAKLEEFLLPNKMNWSVPDWMERKLENDEISSRVHHHSAKRLNKFRRKDKSARVVEGKVQDILGGAEFYAKIVSDPNETYENFFHHLFNALFKPSPPIAGMVDAKMREDNLKPGEYAIAHYRAFYGIEDRKKKRKRHSLTTLAINAANCASAFRPGGPVYFASDSKVAVDAVKKYGETHNRSISVLEGDEALHIDKFGPDNARQPSDFYPVFVDLLLMASGKCVTYGQGGFGRFALLLSQNATCVGRHIYRLQASNCSWVSANFDYR